MKIRFLLPWLLTPGMAFAQDGVQPSPVKPSPPFVSPMPAHIEYIKTFAYPAAAAKGPRTPEQIAAQKQMDGAEQIQSMDTVKVGDVSKTLCTFTSGETAERWIWKNYSIEGSHAHPEQIFALPITEMDTVTRERIPSFSEVSWVGLATYTGEQTRQGHRYFTYKQGDQSAWIDEDTRLPASYTSSRVSITYVYKETPTGPLELPENMKKRVVASQNAYRGAPVP